MAQEGIKTFECPPINPTYESFHNENSGTVLVIACPKYSKHPQNVEIYHEICLIDIWGKRHLTLCLHGFNFVKF